MGIEAKKVKAAPRHGLINFILVMISLTIGYGVAEFAVRIYSPQEVSPIRFKFDPQLGDIPTPNQTGRRIRPGQFDYTFSNNSLGLRGSKEYSLEKPTEHRILLLGDSFTYGFGVNDDQTFAYLTEKRLLNDRLSVEVMNAGNSGKGTDYELIFYQVLGYKYQPDLIILCFCANDFIDNERGEYYSVSQEGELSLKLLNQRRRTIKIILNNLPGYNWLISWSQAANFLKEATIKWHMKHGDPQRLKEAPLVISYPQYIKGYVTENNQRLTEIYVQKLIRSVKNNGGSLLFFYIPMSMEVEAFKKNGEISKDERAIKAIAQKYGQRLDSFTQVFAASPEPPEKFYFPIDGHWNAAGHALAARYLSEQIGNRLQKH